MELLFLVHFIILSTEYKWLFKLGTKLERQRKNGLLALKSVFEILTHLYLNTITNGASG